jgi:hypothetical protein
VPTADICSAANNILFDHLVGVVSLIFSFSAREMTNVAGTRQTHSTRASGPARVSRDFSAAWSIEKLILPSAAASIARNFYGVTLPASGSYVLGIAELVLSLALLFGFYRTISYGLSLLVHTVTVIVSWRQLFDPWGLAKVGSHLWISTWPTWGALPRCS